MQRTFRWMNSGKIKATTEWIIGVRGQYTATESAIPGDGYRERKILKFR